ncbi:MAG: DinB family protein [Vicinamibacterales bacterium]
MNPALDTITGTRAIQRATELADRLEQGTQALVALATGLSDEQWRTKIPGDGRTVGVVVHHVASVYPIEIELATTVGSGRPVEGVTMADIHTMNAEHAAEHATVSKDEAITLLITNGTAAAQAIRGMTDAELATAANVSLYAGAPLTAQFVLEDHAVRHSYHHAARIRAALNL